MLEVITRDMMVNEIRLFSFALMIIIYMSFMSIGPTNYHNILSFSESWLSLVMGTRKEGSFLRVLVQSLQLFSLLRFQRSGKNRSCLQIIIVPNSFITKNVS